MNDLYVMGVACSRNNLNKRFLDRLEMTLGKLVVTRTKTLRSYVFYLVFIKILFCVCLAHARQQGLGNPVATGVALSTDSIKPLQIGDTIPDVLWKLPLQMVKAGQEGSATVRLNDYKGKLIILDFWATWCGGCIAGLPKLLAFEREHDLKLVPVTDESITRVDAFLKKSTSEFVRVMKDDFHSIVENKAVKKYFPSMTIPHTIVVGPEGEVLAITTADFLNDEIIENYVAGNYKANIPSKKENFNEPLLIPSANLPELRGTPYYATLVGALDGLVGTFISKRDSSKNAYHLMAVSRTIMQLYITALAGQFRFEIVPNRRILEVRKPEDFLHHKTNEVNRTAFNLTWKRNNKYTYQSFLPISTSDSAARSKMRSDLDVYLGLHGRIENRAMRSLVLRCHNKEQLRSKEKGAFYSVGNGRLMKRFADKVKEMPLSKLGAKNYLRNMGFDKMVDLLNRDFGDVPPIFDGTDIDFLVDIDLPDNFTMQELITCFEKQSLYFEEEVRTIPMLVISEPDLENASKLILTKYGYTPESLN